MDKYVMMVMIFLLGGMIIGITQVPPRLEVFYGGLAGVIIIIIHQTAKNRREQGALRRERRKR